MKLPQLTVSRFVAAMCIVALHFGHARTLQNFPILSNLMSYFDALVDYFFVLSGFILVVSTGSQTGSINVAQFWSNRIARIYPLYYLALFCTIILLVIERGPLGFFTGEPFMKSVLTSLFLVQAWFPDCALTLNYPGWSLSVEAFFYLLFPFIYQAVVRLPTARLVGLSVLAWTITQAVYIYLRTHGFEANAMSAFPPFHLSTFLVGTCTGVVFLRHPAYLHQQRWVLSLLLLGCIVGCAYLIMTNPVVLWHHQAGLLAPVFVLLVLTLSVPENRLTRLLSRPGLVYLGEISYGIYILQMPVSGMVYGLNRNYFHLDNTTAFMLFVPVLILTSAICYEWVERPWRSRVKLLLGVS